MKPIVVVVLLALVSCSKPKPAVIPAIESRPGPVSPRPPASGVVVTPRTFDESILRGHEFLLELDPAVTMAQDPVVGPLSREPRVTQAVETLFQAAAQGDLDAKTLVPRWAEYLQAWARRARADGLGSGTIRTGEALNRGPEGWMIPVRVFGGKHEFQGWVLLVPADSAYLVSDVQIVPSTPPSGPLDPESPDQPISRPSRL